MRVLLLADDDGTYAEAAEPLRARGHEVVGCHEAGSTAGRWPCTGVAADCPLDEGIDVAVAFHTDGTDIEAGVGCVVRQKVPLVIGGHSATTPMAPFADAIIEGTDNELVEAVERLDGATLAGLSSVATAAAAGVADRLEMDGLVEALVSRHRRTVRVTVHGPPSFDQAQRNSCAHAAFAAVRDAIPSGAVDKIDVAFNSD